MDSPNEKVTDPAARLLDVLRRVSSHANNGNYEQLWTSIFSLPDDDFVAISHHLDLLREQANEVERAIKQVPDLRPEKYLQPVASLRNFLNQKNLGTGWSSQRQNVDVIIVGLEFCSERLQHHFPETEIPASELDGMRKSVEELTATLKQSTTIPRRLKLILADLLEALRRAIDEYIFRGPKGLRKEMSLIVLQLRENYELVREANDDESVKGLFAVLKKIDALTATALKVKELGENLAPYLPSLLEFGAKIVS